MYRLYSTLASLPAGFQHGDPSLVELVAFPFVLLCDDLPQRLQAYGEQASLMTGVFVTPGPRLAARIDERLWHLSLPDPAEDGTLELLLQPLLATLARNRDQQDRVIALERLLDRSQRDLQISARDYRRANQSLVRKVEDLTAAKEEIAALNARLEARVQERTAELEASLAHLQQTQEQLVHAEKMAALGNVVAGVAHEINTPLGNCVMAVSGIEALIDELDHSLAGGAVRRQEVLTLIGELREGFGLVNANINRGADLISRFKQVAADQSSEARRPFDLREVLEDTLAAMSPRIDRQRCEAHLAGDAAIPMDSYPGDFSQILMNLVMNSLVHGLNGHPGGRIEVMAEVRGERCRLHYRDNGSGMSEAVRGRIFEPFFTTARGAGGTGLGMPIIYGIVTKRLGGSIEVESTPRQGVSFRIEVPLRAPAEA